MGPVSQNFLPTDLAINQWDKCCFIRLCLLLSSLYPIVIFWDSFPLFQFCLFSDVSHSIRRPCHVHFPNIPSFLLRGARFISWLPLFLSSCCHYPQWHAGRGHTRVVSFQVNMPSIKQTMKSKCLFCLHLEKQHANWATSLLQYVLKYSTFQDMLLVSYNLSSGV